MNNHSKNTANPLLRQATRAGTASKRTHCKLQSVCSTVKKKNHLFLPGGGGVTTILSVSCVFFFPHSTEHHIKEMQACVASGLKPPLCSTTAATCCESAVDHTGVLVLAGTAVVRIARRCANSISSDWMRELMIKIMGEKKRLNFPEFLLWQFEAHLNSLYCCFFPAVSGYHVTQTVVTTDLHWD